MNTTQDWLDQVQADSLARLEAVDRMQRQLQEVVGRAESRDRAVRVQVTPAGALTDLHISEGAMSDYTAEQLASTIRALAAEAAAGAAAQVRDIVGEVVPVADLDAMMNGQVTPSTRRAVDDELRARRGGQG